MATETIPNVGFPGCAGAEGDRLKKDVSSQDKRSTQTSIPDIVCPHCGAGIKKRNGTKKTEANIFQRYTCLNGHNFTDDQHPINK